MEGVGALAVASCLLIVGWKWPWAAWILGSIAGVLALAMIVDDERRHDDFLDGLGTMIGIIGLGYAVLLVGLGFLGRYVRKRRAAARRQEPAPLPVARVVG